MRAPLAALLVAACGAPAATTVVSVPASSASANGAPGTLLGECRITGKGERSENQSNARFDVFASRDAIEPSLVIASPEAVAIAWSHFPVPSERAHRARVGLGGQKHVRFDGWSSLEGRTFTLEQRFYAEPGHLWALAGAPIEMAGAEGNVAIARVGTPFLAPKTLGLVAHDAALFVGKSPVAVPGAIVEKDAEIRYTGVETTVSGHTFIAFDFEDGTIVAPAGSRMWIANGRRRHGLSGNFTAEPLSHSV